MKRILYLKLHAFMSAGGQVSADERRSSDTSILCYKLISGYNLNTYKKKKMSDIMFDAWVKLISGEVFPNVDSPQIQTLTKFR